MSSETGLKAKNPPCLGCKEKITARQTSVMCYICERWTHPKCSNIVPELLKFLGQGVSWSCDSCKVASENLNKKMIALNRDMEEMKKDMKKMEDNHNSLKQQVNKIQEQCDRNEVEKEKTKDDVKQAVFNEMRERDDKRCNFIIHGIPEVQDAKWSGYDKKDLDICWLEGIMDALDIEFEANKDMKFIRRLGDQKEESCRPILVGCKEEEMKLKVIRECRKLGNLEEWEDIYVVPDLTRQQRREEAEMVKEMYKRNSELSTEDALNSEWRMVGLKGEKRLILGRKKTASKGQGRPNQTRKRLRTPEAHGSDKRLRERADTETEDVEEEEMEGGGTVRTGAMEEEPHMEA